MTDDARAAGDELQFDRVERAGRAAPDAAAGPPGVVCAGCGTTLRDDYWHVNGRPACARCRDAALAVAEPARGVAPMALAAALGVGAAIAGAAVYYAVIAITHLEIGIVAIVIGYMVGWAVRKGAAGRGGRRFQVLAVVLTYWSVGLAYAPLVFRDVTAQGLTPRALGALFAFVFALPVTAVVGSLPGGLISAFIIFIGLRQAWRMTAAPTLVVTGPHRVGAGPAAAPV